MWNPEDYARNSDAQLKWAQELRSRLPLNGTEAILDVGCGDGKITADFATALPHGNVVGIDNSPEMIAYATRTYPPARYPNLRFECLDARSFSFLSAFDLIFSNAALHWVDDHSAFLRAAHRALRPDGRLILSCGGKGNAADILHLFAELTTTPPWNIYFTTFQNPYFFYGTQEYKSWLQAAGFQVQRLELVPKDMTHSGKAGLSAWIRTTAMPITHQIPESERETFVQQFVETYLDRFPLDDQGRAHVHMVRLEVEAVKKDEGRR